MICCLFFSTVFAAPGEYSVTATLNPDLIVKIDGVEQTFYNAQGQEVHPISYAGTTYIPLRAIGEIMGKNVDWNASTYTATIGGARVTPPTKGTPDKNAKKKNISLFLEPKYTIIIDGTARTFYDVNGKVCDPSNYQGSIYLPIRAIGEIMGKTVGWDGKTQTVTLTTPASGEVTDFDTSSIGTTTVVPTTNGNIITAAEAKNIALKHAGKAAVQVTFAVEPKLDYDDGIQVYEVEFYEKISTGYIEYDYEINAATGKIKSFDNDIETTIPYSNTSSNAVNITASQAKTMALNKVPGATNSNIREFETDYDDGRKEYEGKIIYNKMEYEFKIDAATGTFLEWDVESIYD